MHRVEDLKIWRKSIELTKVIYILTKQLPKEEQFGLIMQMKRSSVSIASNIAEGAGRNSTKEFLRFLSIANGSCFELHTQLILVIELGLLNERVAQPALGMCVEIKRMNYALRRKL